MAGHDLFPDTTPERRIDREELGRRLREAFAEKKQSALPESAQRLDDAIARDQKWDCRISMGERELWDRAAQVQDVTTSEYVRAVVNHDAE